MSYLVRRRQLGDVITSPITNVPDEYDMQMACLNKANSSPQVVAIDNLIANLTRTWNPTGYFRPADVQSLLDVLATEAEAAGAALAAAPLSTGDAAESKAQAFDDMLRRYKDRSQAYVKALADAKASGATAINAPALKDWVISSMRSISDAYVTATVLQCRQSWAEKWLDRAYRGMAAIGAVAARILGVVITIGENVVDAVDNAGKILAVVIKYAPYAAVGIGGYFLYKLYKKRRA